jgi:hypothetical protein
MVVGIDGLGFASEFVVFKLSCPSVEASEVIVFGDGFSLAKGVVFSVGDDVFGILDVGTTIESVNLANYAALNRVTGTIVIKMY